MATRKISDECPCGQFNYTLTYKTDKRNTDDFQYCMFCGILLEDNLEVLTENDEENYIDDYDDE